MATEYSSKVLTVSGVAAYLKIHPSTVYRLTRRGILPSFKVGDGWRFNIEAIDRWRSEWTPGKPHQGMVTDGTRASTPSASLSVRAYQAWLREQVQALRKRDLQMIDWDNLAEELEGLARNHK